MVYNKHSIYILLLILGLFLVWLLGSQPFSIRREFPKKPFVLKISEIAGSYVGSFMMNSKTFHIILWRSVIETDIHIRDTLQRKIFLQASTKFWHKSSIAVAFHGHRGVFQPHSWQSYALASTLQSFVHLKYFLPNEHCHEGRLLD